MVSLCSFSEPPLRALVARKDSLPRLRPRDAELGEDGPQELVFRIEMPPRFGAASEVAVPRILLEILLHSSASVTFAKARSQKATCAGVMPRGPRKQRQL